MSTETEDEGHFLNICPLLSEIRIPLYDLVASLTSEEFLHEKTAIILKLCATEVSVGKIISDMYSRRNNRFYAENSYITIYL